VQLFEKYAL
jgi:hypothetical protein